MFYSTAFLHQEYPKRLQRLPTYAGSLHLPHRSATRFIQHPSRNRKELPLWLLDRPAVSGHFVVVTPTAAALNFTSKPRMPSISNPPNQGYMGFVLLSC